MAEKEYIERDAALDALCKASVPCFSATGKPILDVDYVPAINAIPAADVVPGSDFRDCRNELCLYCGKYNERHNGACDGCRWKERGNG